MTMTIAIKYARLPNDRVHFYQHWIPDSPRALVVFVHGLGDHIGRLGPFVSRLTQKNVACALYDQQGHGRSDGRRGHVERFSDWVNDLAGFVQFSQMATPTDTPLFIVGTSLGALIGINYILTHTAPVAGMVAISAAIHPTVQIPEWKKKLGRRIFRLWPSVSIDDGVRIEDLTRDEAERESLRRDPLFHRRLTLCAAHEIERNLELVMAMPHRIHVPMLMLAGAGDRVCDPEGTRQFATRLSSTDKHCRIYPGMFHDLLHDSGNEIVLDDIEAWIGVQADRPAQKDRQFALHRRETLWEDVSSPSA